MSGIFQTLIISNESDMLFDNFSLCKYNEITLYSKRKYKLFMFLDRDADLIIPRVSQLIGIFGKRGIFTNLLFFLQNFTKSLTNSDRASLFLLDTQRKELFSRIFDAGVEPEKYMGSEIRQVEETLFLKFRLIRVLAKALKRNRGGIPIIK